MTKSELQVALAAATETNKRNAGVFLDTLSNLAYKETKKNGEFVLPGFGKLVKQKRKARWGFNSEDATENQDSGQNFSKADQYSPHLIGTTGNETLEIGEWGCTVEGHGGSPAQLKGYYSSIYIRAGNDWKISMVTSNMTQ